MKNRLPLVTIISLVFCPVYAEGDHHHDFAPDVAAFHEVLAPLWHAPESAERTKAICAKQGDLTVIAKKIKSQDPANLLKTLSSLSDSCAGKQATVAATFSSVHDAFHLLIDAH